MRDWIRGGPEGRRAALLALLAVGLVLGGAAAVLPHGVFWHSDEGAKFLQVLNLRLGPNGLQSSVSWPGDTRDPALRFVPFHPKQYHLDAAGGIVLQWPVFLALLTWPFYALFGLAGLGVLPLAGALGACWGSYRLARVAGAAPGWAWIAIPLTGLATPLGFYSWVFFEHTLAAALVAAAVERTISGLTTRRPARLVVAGLALGVAIYLRSELYALVPVLAAGILAWAWWTHAGTQRMARAAVSGLAGLLIALVPLWAFYTQSEGGPLPQHATWYFDGGDGTGTGAAASPRLPEVRYLAQSGLNLVPDFLAGPSAPDAPAIPPWVSGALVLGTLAVLAVGRLPRGRELVFGGGLALVGAGSLAVLIDPAPYGSLHGFVLAAPMVALAAWPRRGPGAPGLHVLQVITALYIVLHVLVISTLSGLGPISRYEWGQRYLLPAYPLLIALVVATLSPFLQQPAGPGRRPALRTRLPLLAAGLLALIGAGFLARGWTVLRQEKTQVLAWQQTVAGAPDQALLTDRWWVPLLLAPQFYNHTWYLAPDEASARAWAGQVATAPLLGFSTVTFTPTLRVQLATVSPPLYPGATISGPGGLQVQHFDRVAER
ncbi:MAG TPA: hypothetical protein VM536_22315 [Chloroflexia bacterium]|nr:hypothetical protein [Chloroflexia bacterium]